MEAEIERMAEGAMGGKHRGVDFFVKQLKPSEWQWTYYPKMLGGPVDPKVSGVSETQGQAEAACKKAIDERLDQAKT
jgi:hypothetical protein